MSCPHICGATLAWRRTPLHLFGRSLCGEHTGRSHQGAALLFFEGDRHGADIDAKPLHVGDVEETVLAQQPHPIIKRHAQHVGAFRAHNGQINRVAPVESISALFTKGHTVYTRRGALPRLLSGLLQGPNPLLDRPVFIDEILNQPQCLAIPRAIDRHLKTAAHGAKNVLELTVGHRPPLEELFEIELPVRELGVIKGRLARTGSKKKGGCKDENTHVYPTHPAQLWTSFAMLDDADDIHPLFHGAPKTTEFKKLRKRIIRDTRQAIEQYGMVEKGGKWLVCLSGGKDSYTLLAALTELQWRGLLPVEILACNLDQGQPGFPATVLPEFLTQMEVPHRIEYQDTYSIVMDRVPAGRTYCALCSRLRLGNLYRIAREEGCTAVVLGHHRDDILETFFMNLFHGSRLATMPPKLVNEEGDLFVYRPLAHVSEADCEAFSKAMNYPIIPCDLCGSQDGLQRQQVKGLLDTWEANHPGRRQKMFRALMNTRPSHLLDPELFDFAGLTLKDKN